MSDAKIHLKYHDERKSCVELLQLGAAEQDAIREIPQTEVNLIEAYASLSRIRDDVTDRVLMFAFKDFGDAKPPMWSRRRELMSSYLIGTQPLDKEVKKACEES